MMKKRASELTSKQTKNKQKINKTRMKERTNRRIDGHVSKYVDGKTNKRTDG